MNLAHIESRSSKRAEDAYEFMIEVDDERSKAGIHDVQAALDSLKEMSGYYQVIGHDYKDHADTIPWFPRSIKDLKPSRSLKLKLMILRTPYPKLNRMCKP